MNLIRCLLDARPRTAQLTVLHYTTLLPAPKALSRRLLCRPPLLPTYACRHSHALAMRSLCTVVKHICNAQH